MEEKSIEEKNITIAKWLGLLEWTTYSGSIKYCDPNVEIINGSIKTSELKFHSDSNWQWVCLEKIVELFKINGYNYSIADVIMQMENNYSVRKEINSKQDLFEAIYNYIIQNNNEKR